MSKPSARVNSGLHQPKSPALQGAAVTRARILASAQQIFLTHGYAHAGMREIAAGAGINVALVARYFGSKEKLFEAALDALLQTPTLTGGPRAQFGRSVVNLFLDEAGAAMNPLPLLMQAAADPITRPVALALLQERVLGPLAEWLGPPQGQARAAEILAICAGFFTYRIMLPLEEFSGTVDPSIRQWLQNALQDVVDGRGMSEPRAADGAAREQPRGTPAYSK